MWAEKPTESELIVDRNTSECDKIVGPMRDASVGEGEKLQVEYFIVSNLLTKRIRWFREHPFLG